MITLNLGMNQTKLLFFDKVDFSDVCICRIPVLAIQALSEVAALLTQRNQNLSLTFRHSSDQSYLQEVTHYTRKCECFQYVLRE